MEPLVQGQVMFVFDGDCGFCSRYAYWVAGPLPSEIDVVPWQELDDLDAYGLTRQDVECAAWWLDGAGRWSGGDAIATTMVAAGMPWTILGRLMLIWPLSLLSRVVYGWIAHNRHRLPGATPACEIEGRKSW